MSGQGQLRGQEQSEAPGDQRDQQEVARAAGTGEGGASPQDTPPGGDVRTVYSSDRDPGETKPEPPQPS
jgi:hypothetical protein